MDGTGTATAWSTLTVNSDTTSGFTADGVVAFDPPSGWLPCKVPGAYPSMHQNGGDYRYYVLRFRVTGAGTAPYYALYTSRDYYGGGDNIYGTIPAFDATVNANGDGYLSLTEYNNVSRDPAKTARFAYESRLPMYYGAQRLTTKVGDATTKAWASTAFCNNLIAGTEYNGVAMDNSFGLPIFPTGAVPLEPTAAYAAEYGTCLQYIWNHLPDHPVMGQRWIMPNLNGSTVASATEIIARVPVYDFEAFLRPRENNWSIFENNSSIVTTYQAMCSPPPLGVLDLFVNLNTYPDDWYAPWSLYNCLCYYYMLCTPDTVVTLMGADPAYAYHFRFSYASRYDIGRACGAWSVFATGQDPQNTALAYKVYTRKLRQCGHPLQAALLHDRPRHRQPGLGHRRRPDHDHARVGGQLQAGPDRRHAGLDHHEYQPPERLRRDPRCRPDVNQK